MSDLNAVATELRDNMANLETKNVGFAASLLDQLDYAPPNGYQEHVRQLLDLYREGSTPGEILESTFSVAPQNVGEGRRSVSDATASVTPILVRD